MPSPKPEGLEAKILEGQVVFRCNVDFHPHYGKWLTEEEMTDHLEHWFIAHNISPVSAPRIIRELTESTEERQ